MSHFVSCGLRLSYTPGRADHPAGPVHPRCAAAGCGSGPDAPTRFASRLRPAFQAALLVALLRVGPRENHRDVVTLRPRKYQCSVTTQPLSVALFSLNAHLLTSTRLESSPSRHLLPAVSGHRFTAEQDHARRGARSRQQQGGPGAWLKTRDLSQRRRTRRTPELAAESSSPRFS